MIAESARRELRLRDALRHGALIGLWVGAATLALDAWRMYWPHFGHDAHAYWVIAHGASLYGRPPTTTDAYLYSPLFAQITHPLALLPWPVFLSVWMIAEAAAFWWLLRPLGWTWALPLMLVCSPEIDLGNVISFLGVMLVLGLRRPGFWSFGLLTKVTPGGLGLMWHLARGEWRKLAIAGALAVCLVALSAAFWPTAWMDWFRFLSGTHGASDVLVRTVAGLGLVVVAARLDRPWLLAVATLLAYPVLVSSQALTILAAIPRLLRSAAIPADSAPRPEYRGGRSGRRRSSIRTR